MIEKQIMQQCIYFLDDNEPFHQTAVFHEAKQYLEIGGKFQILSEMWGSGKPKTAKEVYRSLTGKSPKLKH